MEIPKDFKELLELFGAHNEGAKIGELWM